MNLHAHQFVMIRILPMRRPREESYADHAGSASIVILFVIPGFLGQWVIDRFIVRPGKTDLQTILTSIAASCAIWAFWYPVMLLVRHLSSNVAVQVVLLFLALFVTPVVGALVMSAPDLRVRTWVNERLYTWLPDHGSRARRACSCCRHPPRAAPRRFPWPRTGSGEAPSGPRVAQAVAHSARRSHATTPPVAGAP